MTLKVTVFEKTTKVLTNFAFYFFVYFLPILINEKAYTTSLVFEKDSFKQILGRKYGISDLTACSRKFYFNLSCLHLLFFL